MNMAAVFDHWHPVLVCDFQQGTEIRWYPEGMLDN